MKRDDVVRRLSEASGPYGELLIELMESVGVFALSQVSDEQASCFYERWTREATRRPRCECCYWTPCEEAKHTRYYGCATCARIGEAPDCRVQRME